MRRVFKTRYFSKWSRKAGVTDPSLCTAVEEMERGLIDADLGGNLYKKRVAVGGRGKRGGVRVLIATRWESRWFFLTGYSKNERSELTEEELAAEKRIGQSLLAATEGFIANSLIDHALEEICSDN